MTDELKPVRCGCGGEAHHDSARCWNPEKEEWIPNFWHRVICKNCGTQTKAFYTEAEAIEAWNRAMGDVAKIATTERTAKVEILEMRNTHNKVWKCSNCGQYMHRANWSREVKYCSHCGARLEWDE